MNNFVFATYSDYKSSRDGGTIANILNAATPSATCISTVTATGKVYIDAINVILPREAGGIGDLLVYSTANGFQWVKGGQKGYGTSYYDTPKLNAADYECIGWMVYREGNEAKIMQALTSTPWGPGAQNAEVNETVTGVHTSTTSHSGQYYGWIGGISPYWGRKYFLARGSWGGDCQYSYPMTEEFWNKCKTAVQTGTTGTITSDITGETYSSCTITRNSGSVDVVMTYRYVGADRTCDPRDYNWDYHAWYRANVCIKKNAYRGTTQEIQTGRENTAAIVKFYPSGNYAAHKCYNYTTDVTGFSTTDWWLPSINEWMKVIENSEQIVKSTGNTLLSRIYYWSSTQYSGLYAWHVSCYNGYANLNSKYRSTNVRALAAFPMIEN